jgi:hypothetical protein
MCLMMSVTDFRQRRMKNSQFYDDFNSFVSSASQPYRFSRQANQSALSIKL